MAVARSLLRRVRQRGTTYATLSARAHLRPATDADAAALGKIVGDAYVATGTDDLRRFNTDWLRQYPGAATVAVRPRSSAEVAEVIRYCRDARVGVVPQGGNTGLVGGSVATGPDVVLSLERMNSVLDFDATSGVLVCEAGAVLGALGAHLAPLGWMMPLDLGAKGSCHIGGNVSTNAGGLRYLRYGSLHGSVLGLKAVAGTGEVLDALSRLRKDNVGYDVKQLFIGSEGTLGVVTEVAIQAVPLPSSVQVCLLACPSFAACVDVLGLARGSLGELLSAAEFVDAAAMAIMLDSLPPSPGGASGTLSFPLASRDAPFYVVIETQGWHVAADRARLDAFLEAAASHGCVTDGAVAQDGRQTAALWRLREDVSVAVSARGHTFKYDLSFPLPRMYEAVDAARSRLAAAGWTPEAHGVVAVGYGHLGDSNLHLNVSTRGKGPEGAAVREGVLATLEPFIFDWTLAAQGSISAEHGLGQSKAAWLPRAKPPAVVAVMRGLKALLDPAGILNPGKVLLPPANSAA